MYVEAEENLLCTWRLVENIYACGGRKKIIHVCGGLKKTCIRCEECKQTFHVKAG
jgi:hypothetical protein